MGKCKRVLRCYHCGAILQTKDPDAKGYISDEVINAKHQANILYCNTCYEVMKSFNSSVLDLQIDQDILKVLDDAIATDAVIIWVVDLFTFNGALNPEIVKKIKNLRLAVVGNKADLLPNKAKKEDIVQYLSERFAEYGLHPTNIKIIQNANKADFSVLLKNMTDLRRGHDVYLIGNSFSGKTTLINRGLKFYTNKTKREIRTFAYEGTDTKVLEIPLSRSSFLYELPGFSSNTSVVNKVEKEVAKIITPKKQVKVTTKTMLVNDCLMIGSLAGFALESGKPTIFKFYSAEAVETKKIHEKNLQSEMIKNNEKRSIRPVSDRYTSFLDFDVFDYSMEKDGKLHDISIEGLGWISFKATGQTIRVFCPKGASVKECLSKIR